MPISPIQLTPSMDMGTMVNAINNNFRQVESENRTKQILNSEGTPQLVIGMYGNSKYGIVGYDIDGTRRLLVGTHPVSNEFGQWITRPGVDVITELGG